jgi:hypothetical protein
MKLKDTILRPDSSDSDLRLLTKFRAQSRGGLLKSIMLD